MSRGTESKRKKDRDRNLKLFEAMLQTGYCDFFFQVNVIYGIITKSWFKLGGILQRSSSEFDYF